MIEPVLKPASDPSPTDPANPTEALAEAIFPAHAPAAIRTFADMKLSPATLKSLDAVGFVQPTPIQAQFIPLALLGKDVLGQAKTGTGKTAAFLLPIFERIKPGTGQSQVLILAPTRELALQIFGEIERLGKTLGFRAITLYGGASYGPQIEALETGVDIVVGTPGRLMDHMRSHRLDLSEVKIAVLDEADRMLDLGFRKDIEYILRHCPEQRQTLLLSATIPDDIKKLAGRFMRHPMEVWTAPESLTVDAVEQWFVICKREEKFPTLLKLLDVEKPRLAIVFCGTKMGAKRLAEKLKRLYISAREIHGDLQQQRREKIMKSFRTGKLQLLIATDVASRGLDIQDITHIINYDIPYKIEDYVHRIGRTGRMEKAGKAYTFVTRDEGTLLTDIEILINRELKRAHFADLTSRWWPTPPAAPPPDYEPETAGGEKGDGRRHKPAREKHGHPATADAAKPRKGRRRSRRERRTEPVTIVCAACGAEATVNFKPTPGRPTYCDPCYRSLKASQPSDGGASAPAEDTDGVLPGEGERSD